MVTVSNVLYRKTHSSAGVARHFDWVDYLSKTRTPRFAHEFIYTYSQSDVLLLQWPKCPP